MKLKYFLVFSILFLFQFQAKTQTIADVVIASENHNTLETALIAADLVTTLKGDGPFTVFAPTDAAFSAIDPVVLNALLKDPSGQLKDILLYHVIGANALSSDLSNNQIIKTVNGKSVEVSINPDGVFINGVKVIIADIKADNGIIHVIDAVMIPN